ncbi:hypothetical protein Fmac_015310 [Flemingia macrophylla]|uniref:Uncharacterized protein n=1 Tax=Flemingia macrophylla TaxID=520843 RepID=A0ABD1MES4_9FABA
MSIQRLSNQARGVDEHPSLVQEMMSLSLEEFMKIPIARWNHQSQIETRHLIEKMAPNSNRDKALDREDGSQLLAARKLEGKLHAIVNLVTQLISNRSLPLLLVSAASILPMTTTLASSFFPATGFSARNDTIVIRGVYDVATDTSAEARKLEGKLDALGNLVTQLAANQKPSSIARVYDIRSSNYHHTSVCLSSQQSGVDEHPEAYAAKPIADHHSRRDKALDREDGSQLLLAENQKPASIARVYDIHSSNDHHTSVSPSSQQSGLFRARNDAIVNRVVHDVATDTSTETTKLEGKLDALMNLVTLLAANQKPASVARVCGIRSSNDHHTSVCPSSQQSGVDEHPEAYAENTYSRPPQQQARCSCELGDLASESKAYHLLQESAASVLPMTTILVSVRLHSNRDARYDDIFIRGVQDVATDTSPKTRKLEGNLYALGNLVTHLDANQKPASIARVCDIHSSNDHYTSVCPSSQQSKVDEHPEAYAANTYSRTPQQQRHGT